MEAKSNKTQFASEHTELCLTLPVKKKCKKCYYQYDYLTRKAKKKKKDESVIKTRLITNKQRSKYFNVFCVNCKESRPRDLCKECHTKYDKAKSRDNYCKNKHLKLLQKQKNINDLTSKCQTDNNKDNVYKNSVKKQSHGKKLQLSTNLGLGHTACSPLRSPARHPAVKKTVNFKSKRKVQNERLKNFDLNDLENVDITNKYSPKTIANNKSLVRSVIGYSPTKTEELLVDMY